MKALVAATLDVCRAADQYHGKRTVNSIFNHMMSEIGELGIEINIVSGQSYKQPGADGVVGESIDVILSAIDLIYVVDKNVSTEAIVEYQYKDFSHPDDNLNDRFVHLCVAAGFVGADLKLAQIRARMPERKKQEDPSLRHMETTMHVIHAALYLIQYAKPGITDDQILAVAQPKLDKWIQSIKKHSEAQ